MRTSLAKAIGALQEHLSNQWIQHRFTPESLTTGNHSNLVQVQHGVLQIVTVRSNIHKIPAAIHRWLSSLLQSLVLWQRVPDGAIQTCRQDEN